MLEDTIYKDYVAALKSADKLKSQFLSFLRAHFKNAAIGLKKDKLEDNEVLVVLKKTQKSLREEKEGGVSAGKPEIIEKAEKEMAILSNYLPQPLGEDRLREIIEEVIAETGAASMKDMGSVMKSVLAKVGVRADAKHLSRLVKAKLSPGT